MKKYRFEIILFITNAINMILELVASRVLSPYFGSSNIVWTSVIGIILLSSSIGNYLGGLIADKEEINKKLKAVLIFSTLSIFIIPIVQNDVTEAISSIGMNVKIGAIISTMLLFFIPSLFMGYLTPIILKIKLENLENAGKQSGKIYAIATIGSIFGTFLGGFYLVPYFGSVYILFILVIIMALLTFLVDFKFEKKLFIFVLVTIIISSFLMYNFINTNSLNGNKVLSRQLREKVSIDTEYGRVLIYNRVYKR